MVYYFEKSNLTKKDHMFFHWLLFLSIFFSIKNLIFPYSTSAEFAFAMCILSARIRDEDDGSSSKVLLFLELMDESLEDIKAISALHIGNV